MLSSNSRNLINLCVLFLLDWFLNLILVIESKFTINWIFNIQFNIFIRLWHITLRSKIVFVNKRFLILKESILFISSNDSLFCFFCHRSLSTYSFLFLSDTSNTCIHMKLTKNRPFIIISIWFLCLIHLFPIFYKTFFDTTSHMEVHFTFQEIAVN